MIPILYSPGATNFNTLGLGYLSDCKKCVVREARNGEYELSMQYPANGVHFSEIVNSSLIKAKPNDSDSDQLFRVYKIAKPIHGMVTILADHISYQLSYIPLAPFEAVSAKHAFECFSTYSLENNPFTFFTDKEVNTEFVIEEPTSIRSCLGGSRGSILDTYHGEFKFDNYNVSLLTNRGENTGVIIRYGKNLTDLEQEESIENTVTGIVPYWRGTVDVPSEDEYSNETEEVLVMSNEPVYSEHASKFPFKRTIVKDFNDYFDEPPTVAELKEEARIYIENNNIGIPSVNLDIEFLPLWHTEEYKNIALLEQVKLCDTITVEFEELGVYAHAKVIRTEYDVITERYIRLEVGDATPNITKSINTVVESTTNELQSVIKNFVSAQTIATSQLDKKVQNMKGFYSSSETLPDGSTISYMHDRPTRSESTLVVKMGAEAIGISTDGGQTYPFGIDLYNAEAIMNIVRANKISADIVMVGEGDRTVTQQFANIDQKIDALGTNSYSGTDAPTMENLPASQWTAEDYPKHANAIYVNTTNGKTYLFSKNRIENRTEPIAGSGDLVMTTDVQDALVANGNPATFSVGVNKETVTYTWYYKLPSEAEFSPWGGKTTATVELTNLAMQYVNNTQFKCTVADGEGNTVDSSTAILHLGDFYDWYYVKDIDEDTINLIQETNTDLDTLRTEMQDIADRMASVQASVGQNESTIQTSVAEIEALVNRFNELSNDPLFKSIVLDANSGLHIYGSDGNNNTSDIHIDGVNITFKINDVPCARINAEGFHFDYGIITTALTIGTPEDAYPGQWSWMKAQNGHFRLVHRW